MSQVDLYLNAAARANTRRSYASAIQHFEIEWGGLLPATIDSISRYLAAYAESLSLNTLILSGLEFGIDPGDALGVDPLSFQLASLDTGLQFINLLQCLDMFAGAGLLLLPDRAQLFLCFDHVSVAVEALVG